MTGAASLVFPAFNDLPEMTLHLGTRSFESEGLRYTAALADMPYVKTQRGLGQDNVEFSVNDPRSQWYEVLKPYEDVIEDTSLVTREFLRTEQGIYESEITLVGFLEQMSLSESDLALRFTGISDMSRSNFLVGGRILTQRYCGAKFNVNGLRSPLVDACGWTTAQGGNPLLCTHKLKGEDGCEDHNNAHRLFAVEALTTAQVQYTFGGGIGGGGWTYGGGSCFTPNTLVWMADGRYKPIWKVKEGDRVFCFTPTGEIVRSTVSETFDHLVDNHLVFEFESGARLEPTPEHLMNIAPDLFIPAAGLDTADTIRSFGDAWNDTPIWKNYVQEKRTRVHNFHVDRWQTYFVVDQLKKYRFGVHNAKPIYTDFPLGDPYQS